jgi:hypothetical protein
MKHTLFCFALLTLLLYGFGCAKRPDSDFMYPQAILVIESGSTKQTLSIARYSFKPTGGSSCVRHAGGIAFETGAAVTWELVGRTDYGDVYLFMIQRPGMKGMKKEDLTPILFKGVAQELAQFPDLRVELLPKLPAGAKMSTPCLNQ